MDDSKSRYGNEWWGDKQDNGQVETKELAKIMENMEEQHKKQMEELEEKHLKIVSDLLEENRKFSEKNILPCWTC